MRRSLYKYLAVFFIVCFAGTARADAKFEDFFGSYKGFGFAKDRTGPYMRNFELIIRPADPGGFEIIWTTERRRSNDNILITDKTEHSVRFRPSSNPSIFHSVDDVDLLAGKPLSWAKLTGKVLTLYRILIEPNGIPELHVYRRKLSYTGLELEFTASRDGNWIRTVHGRYIKE